MNTKRWLYGLGLLLAFWSISCDPDTKPDDVDPEPQPTVSMMERLQALSGVDVLEIEPPTGFTQAYQIDVRQNLDHDNLSRGTFKQRIFLSHRDETSYMAFFTSGYGVGRNYESEPSRLLQGNQILMVHRFFPNARPDPLDWSLLTIRQAAADQHHIRELLRPIYTGKWVSGGASKGGMTALFYKRFYPQDVVATLAYVAPIMRSTDDPRFDTFLKEVGTAACRKKISDFQREVLNRRQAMLTLLQAHAREKNYVFSRVGMEAAFEYSVLEYLFSFWQYGQENDCFDIPDLSAPDQILFDHLAEVSPFSTYDDSDIEYYEPLFYQAYTEFGYCPYLYQHLKDLLQTLAKPSYRAFAPRVNMEFDPLVMQDIIPWLKTQGERIIYIYGGKDPWSAAALRPDAGVDALFIMQASANHGVKILGLEQETAVIDALNRWLGSSVSSSGLQGQAFPLEEHSFRRF